MSRWPNQEDKTVRAFQAFLNVMDTADWFKNELRGPLESFDLTMGGFRLLEMLYREGALPVPDVARRRLCTRQWRCKEAKSRSGTGIFRIHSRRAPSIFLQYR
jgi:hypothetical protein